jgi:hypothetical protein
VQGVDGQIEHIPITEAGKELLLSGDIPVDAANYLVLISARIGDGIEVVEGT